MWFIFKINQISQFCHNLQTQKTGIQNKSFALNYLQHDKYPVASTFNNSKQNIKLILTVQKVIEIEMVAGKESKFQCYMNRTNMKSA